jgi:hypothetical protein
VKRALLVICVGMLAYVAVAVYAGVSNRSIGNVEAAVYVLGAMLATYAIARVRA